MGRLTLRQRRLLNRGIGPRVQRAWARRQFTGMPNRATLTTAMAGADNDIFLFAKYPGLAGNAVTLTIVVAGNNTPISVSVTGTAITVNAATGSGGAVVSTGRDVVRALNHTVSSRTLVTAAIASGNTGDGIVTALGATSLTGAV